MNLRQICLWTAGALLLLLYSGPSARTADQRPKAKNSKNFSLEFSGEGYMLIPKLRYDGSHPITLEALVKPYDRDDEFIRASVVANLDLSGVGIHYSRDRWMFHVNEGRDSNAGYASTVSNKNVELDKMVHVAGVYDGRKVRLFVNGKLQQSTEETTLKHVPSQFDFMVGADPDRKGKPHQFFKGVIDEVRISKVARYTDDFAPPGKLKSDKNTLALYHLDDGKGKVAKDASGNALHGTVVGAKWLSLDPN